MLDTGGKAEKFMKNKTKQRVKYTDDLGEMDGFDESKILTRAEERALGIPMPGEAKNMRIVRKTPKDARINVRLGQDTLEELKIQAARVGMPYQTLAASVLHMLAKGELQLAFFQKSAPKRARA